jgi:hypothetical protein
MVCYKHVGMVKRGKICEGCLKGDEGKPEHCRKCAIKDCAREKKIAHCFGCMDFPCKRIKNLEKSYVKRYRVSLVENSEAAKAEGVAAFLRQDSIAWTCAECGGAFSLHDGVCSECGAGKSVELNV